MKHLVYLIQDSPDQCPMLINAGIGHWSRECCLFDVDWLPWSIWYEVWCYVSGGERGHTKIHLLPRWSAWDRCPGILILQGSHLILSPGTGGDGSSSSKRQLHSGKNEHKKHNVLNFLCTVEGSIHAYHDFNTSNSDVKYFGYRCIPTVDIASRSSKVSSNQHAALTSGVDQSARCSHVWCRPISTLLSRPVSTNQHAALPLNVNKLPRFSPVRWIIGCFRFIESMQKAQHGSRSIPLPAERIDWFCNKLHCWKTSGFRINHNRHFLSNITWWHAHLDRED